jgi:hypothetical protein
MQSFQRVLLLVSLASLGAAQTVFGIRAAAGSLGGATKVLIQGSGFNRDGRDGQTIV